MATNKSFQLYINDDNVKQYFTASGGALNGAAIGGKYITMRTSANTATFTMNDAGRDILFPSSNAKANKIDIWAQGIARPSSSGNTINISVAGINVVDTQKLNYDLSEYDGSASGIFAKENASVVYTLKINNAFYAAGVRDTSITAYFWQYSCVANPAGNGVKSASVSNAEPYEGETVTFTADLFNGASWDGWYSDADCTNLVSTEQNYTTNAADLNLYAKATIEVAIYNCVAVAGENITSVSVSDSSVVDGNNCTFTAQLNEGCLFDGWYSDSNYVTLVSTSNPYTATITADTTLYAKATRKQLKIIVGASEHGTATVSAATVLYGNNVTFSFTPEADTWELYGWYSDVECTNLVSESNPYSFTATEDITLYPKVGKKRYTITLQWSSSSVQDNACIAAVDFDSLNETEIGYLKTGDYDKIDASKVFAYEIKNGEFNIIAKTLTISVRCPFDMYVAMCVPNHNSDSSRSKTYRYIKNYTWWPYYWYHPTEDATFVGGKEGNNSSELGGCNCIAVAKEGILSVDATTQTVATKPAIFTAVTKSGYKFAGWYSNEACTSLVSSDNPASVVTPKGEVDDNLYIPETTLTLYAKATKISTGTGLYLKQNGAYKQANAIYKKVNGVWTATDKTAFDTTTKYKIINT